MYDFTYYGDVLNLKISKRLQKIANMVKYNNVVDIGTDHALLPVFLVCYGTVSTAIATDVAEGPLARARENITAFGLDGVIKTYLTSGLEGIDAHNRQTCIIAGMGGILIINIISQNINTARNFGQLILAPQRDLPDVRRFLHIHGFVIEHEEIVEDNDKFYNILDCKPGVDHAYTEEEYLFGKHQIASRSRVFKRFLKAEIDKTKKIINGLPTENGRKNELERYLRISIEVINCL